MSFPVFIRCLIVGKANAGNILTVQNGEIGLLGDLTQLPIVVEKGSGNIDSKQLEEVGAKVEIK